MFCPRCSQEQVSDETKFCPRCGLPLGLISEIITNGGSTPQLVGGKIKKNRKWLSRKNGLVFSLIWFIFFALMLTPIVGGLGGQDGEALVFAIIGTMGGMIFAIISFAFLKKTPKSNIALDQESTNYKTQNLYGSQQTVLPPSPQSQTAQSYVSPTYSWRAADTGELVQPQSVTEVTTRLLKKEE